MVHIIRFILDDFKEILHLQHLDFIQLAEVNEQTSNQCLYWNIPEIETEHCNALFLGRDNEALFNLMMNFEGVY